MTVKQRVPPRYKIRKGELITSLDHLAKCDWVIVREKRLSRGWWRSWQIGMAQAYIEQSVLYEGVRLTNGEYYGHLSDEELVEKFGDEIRAIGMVLSENLKIWKECPVKCQIKKSLQSS